MKYIYIFRVETPIEEDGKTHYHANLIVSQNNEKGEIDSKGSVHFHAHSNESNEDAVLKIIKNLFERLDLSEIYNNSKSQLEQLGLEQYDNSLN